MNKEKVGKKYITGISALNIPYNGLQCDWHQVEMLRNNNYSIHLVNFIGAYDIFKDYGLYDGTLFFIKHGYRVCDVLVATPIRAILDMIYYSIIERKKYPKHFMLKDFMFEDIDRKKLSEKLNEMELFFNDFDKDLLNRWRIENDI